MRALLIQFGHVHFNTTLGGFGIFMLINNIVRKKIYPFFLLFV